MEAINSLINQVTSNDVFKDKFLDQFTTNQLDWGSAILSLVISFVLGLVIYFVYKMTFRGVVFSSTFAMSLVLMCVITTVIIVTISSNVVLSLGMVGALSIVRFRSAIKDPIDIMYLFWAISAGIVIGAKQYIFAVIASVLIAVFCFVMHKVGLNKNVYLLIVRYHPQAAKTVDAAINSTGAKVRNRTATAKFSEVTAELEQAKIPKTLVDKLAATDGVISAVLVDYNGEYCA